MKKSARRRKKSASARLRPFWILIVLAAGAAAVGGYYAATWPGFYPKKISVSGNRVVASREILAKAAIAPERNVWLQNAKAAAARIETIPYVETAAVRRSLPANVTIGVSERKPYVRVRIGADEFVVDRSMRVLEPAGDESAELPAIVLSKPVPARPGVWLRESEPLKLQADFERLIVRGIVARAVGFDKYGELVATLRNGITVQFGDDADLEKKAPLVDPILSQIAASRRPVKSLDLRAPSTPVVVYRK